MKHHKEHSFIVGDLAPSTSDSDLKDAFEKYGHLVRATVFKDIWTDDCTGCGLLVFDKKSAMEAVIREIGLAELRGESISVVTIEPCLDKFQEVLPRGVYRHRSFGVGGRGFGQDCYKCGKLGHLAQECRKKVRSIGGRVDSVIPWYLNEERRTGERYGSSGRGDRSRGVGGSRHEEHRTGERYGSSGRRGDRSTGVGGSRHEEHRTGERYGSSGRRGDRSRGVGGSRHEEHRTGERYGSSGRRGDRSTGVGGSRQGSTYTRHRPSPYDRRRR